MTIESFNIQVSDETLDDLKYKLHHVRWPNHLNYSSWDRGTDIDYLKSLIQYWKDEFDWKA